jgi:hypothetical protein
MYDILPFPNITATDTKEQVAQIYNYLIQFKETLEFILTNISADNLSPELRERLNSLGAEIKTTKEEQEDATQQIVHKTITVSDVINSELFKEAVPSDYIVRGEQTTISSEDGGENVYTFTSADGTTDTFRCRNGSKGEPPTVTLDIDYETGELLYTSS